MKLSVSLTALVLTVATASAQNHWWVSTSGNDANPGDQAMPFETINHAATVATAGDVIHLFAESYGDEQGAILLGNKNLTIVGAGVGATVIEAHSSLNVSLPAGLLATPTMDTHRCCIVLQGSATTNIRDLTLDQGFHMPPSGRGYCLWVGGGADAVLDRVDCINARANPINGIQGPLGVNIRGDGLGDTTNVTMRNCRVYEYGKGGVVANFDAVLDMDECEVSGFGHTWLGLAAQNGVQISRGASGVIRRTSITNHWYDPATVVATNMLIYDAAAVTIEDCNIGNGQVGIYFFGTAPTVISGTIARNRIHTATYGIYVADLSGLTFADNSICVAAAGTNDDAWDDAGGNVWTGNHYSVLSADGPYLLPGTGAVTDTDAKALMSGFGASVATALPGGYAPVDMVTADLNGGDADFAALCQAGTPALAIGLNSGGSFAVSGLTFGNSSGDPVEVVAGEFDGNPGTDLAVATVTVPPSITENKVYVFANDGSGNFSLLHTHSVVGATALSGIAATDIDGDGADDLLVTDNGATLVAGSATVLRNNGSGTGFTATALAGGFTVSCRDGAFGDLDNDGDADAVVVEGDAGSGQVHLFEGDGAGNFVSFGSPIASSANPSDVIVGDLDGDGDDDIAVSAARDAFALGAGCVAVLRNDGGSYHDSLYEVGSGPAGMAVGDFDNDADPDTERRDLAVVNLTSGTVSILGGWSQLGAGTGGIVQAGTVATAVAIADVDGDGYADVLYTDVVGGNVIVRYGVVQARADGYGAGTAGTSGKVPNLYPVGVPAVPTIGNPTFGLGLRNSRPLSIAVIAAGVTPAPFAPFGILLGDIGVTWAFVTNVQGRGAVPFPIPNNPAIAGFEIYCQAGVFDPAGNETLFPGFALSNGLKLRGGY
ncbi:MAG: FG-GAP-like repeat-containing protein [Planctomycetota bacterium]